MEMKNELGLQQEFCEEMLELEEKSAGEVKSPPFLPSHGHGVEEMVHGNLHPELLWNPLESTNVSKMLFIYVLYIFFVTFPILYFDHLYENVYFILFLI